MVTDYLFGRRHLSKSSEEQVTCRDDVKQSTITDDRQVELCVDTLGKCYQRVYTITGMCLDESNQWSTKTTTVTVNPSSSSGSGSGSSSGSSSGSDSGEETSDPTCKNGITKWQYCCPSTCINSAGKKQCGGNGCGNIGGDDECCSGNIKKAGLMCSDNVAPCLLF